MLKKILFLFIVLTLVSCEKEEEVETKKDNSNNLNNEEAKLEELLNVEENEMLVATIETNMGTMELELFAKETPKTVKNFAALASQNYYDGIIFHRVIDNFMIQGGDPTGTGSGGDSYYGGIFEDEFDQSLQHSSAGVLSMANRGPNTNGSQFFITLKDTPWLNGKHTVFGKVISGMDVLSSIGKVKTTKPFDKPVNDVVMENVWVEKRSKN